MVRLILMSLFFLIGCNHTIKGSYNLIWYSDITGKHIIANFPTELECDNIKAQMNGIHGCEKVQ